MTYKDMTFCVATRNEFCYNCARHVDNNIFPPDVILSMSDFSESRVNSFECDYKIRKGD